MTFRTFLSKLLNRHIDLDSEMEVRSIDTTVCPSTTKITSVEDISNSGQIIINEDEWVNE